MKIIYKTKPNLFEEPTWRKKMIESINKNNSQRGILLDNKRRCCSLENIGCLFGRLGGELEFCVSVESSNKIAATSFFYFGGKLKNKTCLMVCSGKEKKTERAFIVQVLKPTQIRKITSQKIIV